MPRMLFCALALAGLVGCSSPPTYLEAHGRFGTGEPIDYREDALLFVGADQQTGARVAIVKSLAPAAPPFMGMVIQVDLDAITAPGEYACTKSGGSAQIRVVVPGAQALDTVEYMANGTLDILELPTDGNDRFAGSFTAVRVDYDGQDITVDQGHFRGQL